MANSQINNASAKTVCCLSLTILLATNITSATKIRLPLIHHGSITSSFHQHDIVGSLWPEAKSKAIFLVAVLIGEPPVSQLLAMDTGSEIIWVCTTCGNDYDPKLSSTYETVTCDSTYDQCGGYFYPSMCMGSQCAYNISYADGTYSSGVLAKEKFTFQTSSEGVAELPDTLFGSGLDIKWHGETLSGIFGLNPFGEHSLVTHVGNKFSYCIGNISDPGYMHSHLILGDGAIFEGSSTPLTEIRGKYYVYLDGVSVGDKKLEIDESVFNENTLVDSGATSTILTRGMFDVLRDELERLLNGYHLTPVEIGSLKSCYSGNLFRDLSGFPTVSLRFANGASLDLNVEALFRMETDYAFCLNIEVSESDINTLGVYAQQYYNVGFDFNEMTVSFLNIECRLLKD